MWIKVCGATDIASIRACIDAGVDAVGINLVETSRRFVAPTQARALCDYARGHVELVLVVADVAPARLDELREVLAPTWLQLHGDEPAEVVGMHPGQFKAMPLASHDDVVRAAAMPGELLLVDAKPSGTERGGTGTTCDWPLAAELCARRRVILAGGLTPANVADAIATARPFGVDVATGVELPAHPGRKDPSRVRDFVRSARDASQS